MPGIGLFLTLILTGCATLFATQCAAAPEVKLYVATNGNDAWSGTLPAPNAAKTDGPFATPSRARSGVRAARKAHPSAPVHVYFRGGTYCLTAPLVFTPEDSGSAAAPVVYEAYPGETPVFSGGRTITGWQKEGHLYVADLPDVRAGKWYFRQLFVDGERQIRARTPNYDPQHPTTGGWDFVQPPADEKNGGFGTTLVRIHTPGDHFTWSVNVPADGEYALWLRYGALNKPFGHDTMADRTSMQVDAATPVMLQNLPDTGGWDKLEWQQTATLHLTKGAHKLTWQNVKGGGLNFDAFALCDDPAWHPIGTKLKAAAGGKHVIVVQAEAYESGKGKEAGVQRAKGTDYKDRFWFKKGDIQRWPQSPDPEIHIFPAWGWVNAILSLDPVDFDKGIAYVKNRNCTQDLRPGNRYFVENVREALDTPGEWYLDRTAGKLYYGPRSDAFPRQTVVAPALDRLIEMQGTVPANGAAGKPAYVEYITFRGITFRDTKYSLEMDSLYSPDDAAIRMEVARHCTVDQCRFPGVGGYAVRLAMDCTDNRILRNTINDGGEGGILLIDPDNATQPKRNLIAGNTVHHCGQIWKHVAGVYVTTGSDNHIAYNTITDMPRYGISLKSFRPGHGSHGNIVEHNRIVRTNLETNDTGAIETLGRDRVDSGNIIRYNLILDVVGLKTSPTGEMMTPYMTWGIYLDDYSSGTTITDNIVARTVRGAVHIHLGRNNVITNNIFVDGQDQQIECNGDANMVNNTFEHNIVYYHQGTAIRINKYSDKVLSACDDNVYWDAGATNDAADIVTPLGDFAKWQAAGYDKHSVVADPLFVDPKRDDYSLRPGSPALKLGFHVIDVSNIGAAAFPAEMAAD